MSTVFELSDATSKIFNLAAMHREDESLLQQDVSDWCTKHLKSKWEARNVTKPIQVDLNKPLAKNETAIRQHYTVRAILIMPVLEIEDEEEAILFKMRWL